MASDDELKRLTARAAAGRVVIGLAPLLAPGPSARPATFALAGANVWLSLLRRSAASDRAAR